jgi:prepilin-type N-terminal cleavage/methylation domain-containing protein
MTTERRGAIAEEHPMRCLRNVNALGRCPQKWASRSVGGFTLIELVAAIVVLAMLAGVAVSRYFDHRQRAVSSSESATVRAVRSGIQQYISDASVRGWPQQPSRLDSAVASATDPSDFFSVVLSEATTQGWRKGATVHTYIGPTGATYTYDPATGAFSLTGAAPSGSGTTPAPQVTTSYTNTSSWIAGGTGSPTLLPGVTVGSGYTLVDGVIELTDSSASFNEAARRTVIMGQDISVGSFTLNLDTRLTNYYNQLNYWQVYLVKPGTQMNLSGNALNWGTAPPGAKLVTRDYAPPEKSNGQWHTYSNTFTISAADAAEYSQIVVMMAGSRAPGQTLS